MEELMHVEAHWNGFQIDLYLPLSIPKDAHTELKKRIDKSTSGLKNRPADLNAMKHHVINLARVEIAHMVRCGELYKLGDKWEYKPLEKKDGKDL